MTASDERVRQLFRGCHKILRGTHTRQRPMSDGVWRSSNDAEFKNSENAHGPDMSEQCPDAANLQNGRAAHRQAYPGDYTSGHYYGAKEIRLVPPQR
jgi:hypothetical protein